MFWYNDNYRLISQLRNDNLQLRNFIVSEYNRSINDNTNDNTNANTNINTNRRRRFFNDYRNSSIRREDTPYPHSAFFSNTFFDSVPMPPSQEEINAAILTTNYNNIRDPLNTSCPITLDSFDENTVVCLIKYCGHIFKPQSLSDWFRENNRCPICRYDIRTYTSESDNNYDLYDASNVMQFVSNNNTNTNTNNNDNNETNTSANTTRNPNNLNVNTNLANQTELTRQLDAMLLQLFNSTSSNSTSSSSTHTNIDADTSGNFLISYTIT